MKINFESLNEPSIYNVFIKSKPRVKAVCLHCFAKMPSCTFSFYKFQMKINVSTAQGIWKWEIQEFKILSRQKTIEVYLSTQQTMSCI